MYEKQIDVKNEIVGQINANGEQDGGCQVPNEDGE
jgi:hypothetical protein